jgi:hypothetical protein
VFEKSVAWVDHVTDHGAKDTHSFQGVTTHTTPGESWTLASSNWAHLIATSLKTGKDLVQFVQSEIEYRDPVARGATHSPAAATQRSQGMGTEKVEAKYPAMTATRSKGARDFLNERLCHK